MGAPIQVVVTGMGVIAPAGVGLDEFHEAQLAARSAVRRMPDLERVPGLVNIAAAVELPSRLVMPRREAMRTDRCTQLGAAAAELAVEHAKLDLDDIDRGRAGVMIGTGAGGMGASEESCRALVDGGPAAVRARTIPMLMLNAPAAHVAIRYGLTGPCASVATACASAGDSIIAAVQMIRAGEADLVLAGGTEAPITPFVMASFGALGALADDTRGPAGASRPFDVNRTGFVMAEGAGVLVLESAEHAAARGAQVYAVLAGYGRTADATHVTMPHPEGIGAAAAITAALRSAGASPSDVGMVNAHGTATRLNDAAEAAALRAVLGPAADHVPVAATKSIIGHTLGAAGAVEAIATIQAMTSGLVPPTANLDDPDPDLPIDVVRNRPRETSIDLALSNSFAFGGHNVVLAFARPS